MSSHTRRDGLSIAGAGGRGRCAGTIPAKDARVRLTAIREVACDELLRSV